MASPFKKAPTVFDVQFRKRNVHLGFLTAKQSTGLFVPIFLRSAHDAPNIEAWGVSLLAATAEGFACTLRIPLNDEGEWSRRVLGYPEEYFAPCFIAVGKPEESAIAARQKEYSLPERIHSNVW